MVNRREKWATRVADLSGRLLRRTGRTLPGVLGPALVCIGLGLAWLPLGLMAAGAVLWLVDWRIPDEQATPRLRYADGRDRLRAVG